MDMRGKKKAAAAGVEFRCANVGCNVTGRDLVDKQCARCRRTWYCSERCQSRDWENHREVCKTFRKGRTGSMQYVNAELYASLFASVQAKGYTISRYGNGFEAVLQDPTTGELYESMSNRTLSTERESCG